MLRVMRKGVVSVLAAMVLAGGVMIPLDTQKARADCVDDCIEEFDSSNAIVISIRGWCMIFRCTADAI